MFCKNFLLLVCCLLFCGLIPSEAEQAKCCSGDPITVCNCSGQKLTKIIDEIGQDVKTLDLSNNDIQKITNIPETEALEKLELSNNKIATISYDAFDNLDYLKVLILSHNELTKIGDDIFEWNPLELRVIHLDHNKLEFIQHFLFYDLDQLFEIDLSFNNISFIHPHAFGQLKTLVTLKLNSNSLHTLDHRWFSPLSSDYLASMDLTNNPWSCDCAMQKRLDSIQKMQHITEHIDDLRCVRGDLQGQRILSIKKDQKLTCQSPVITGISSDSVMYAGKTLKLQCKLDQDRVPSANVVWIAPNHDTYNYHNADKFDGIEANPYGELLISEFRESDAGVYECHATNDGGEVTATTTVKFDSDEKNTKGPVMESPDDAHTTNNEDWSPANCPKGCKCVSRMADCGSAGDPTKDKLQDVPTGIPQDSYSINLVSNEIKAVKAGTLNFPQLIELRFDDNFIKYVEEHSFDGLPKLKTLSLKNNKIETLPANIFVNLLNLDKLILDNNELVHLDPDVFKGLGKLMWLYIRDNKLLEIKDSTFKPLQSLEYIHLENNHLHSFPLDIAKELTERDASGYRNVGTIKRIFVMGNEFYCDCRFLDLHQYLTEHHGVWEDLFGDGIQCGFPDNHIDQFLMSIPKEQLTCESHDGEMNGTTATTTTVSTISVGPAPSKNMTGLWFGGMILGIVLCIIFLYFIRKRNGRSCLKSRSTNYAHLNAQDADFASLVGSGSTTGGGSEAFV